MKIEFGILSYKLLIPLLYPIFNQVKKLDYYNNTSPLYQTFSKSVSYLLAGLVYLLVLYKSKKPKKIKDPKNSVDKPTIIDQVYLENKNILKKRRIKKLISIFFLSLINLIPTVAQIFGLTNEDFARNLGVLFTILFYVVFSKIFLKTKIFRHQIISLVTISLCLLIFLFRDIKQEYSNSNFFITLRKLLLYFILVYGLNAVSDVLIKKHFEVHSNIPYHLMFFLGLFSFILLIPLDLFCIF